MSIEPQSYTTNPNRQTLAEKYSKIICELEKRNIFTDNVTTSPKGMVAFRLKDMSNIKWNDFNDTYIHEIVFNFNENEYINENIDILLDSILDKDIRYIYFTAKTGH